MHGSRFLSLGALVTIVGAGCAAFAARSLDVVTVIERRLIEPVDAALASFVASLTALLAIAFPAPASLAAPDGSTDAPRVIGLDQVRSFLSRRAERTERRPGGGWSTGGLQLAA